MTAQQFIEQMLAVRSRGTMDMKLEAYVDMGNGIDNLCEIVAVLYDENDHRLTVYVDGSELNGA